MFKRFYIDLLGVFGILSAMMNRNTHLHGSDGNLGASVSLLEAGATSR
jgi:hypothetical protein